MFSRNQAVRKRIEDFRLQRHFRKRAVAASVFPLRRRSSIRSYESTPPQHDVGTLAINSLSSFSDNAFAKLKKPWNPKEYRHDVRSTENRSATSGGANRRPSSSSFCRFVTHMQRSSGCSIIMSGWCNASRSFFERREKPPLPTGVSGSCGQTAPM